jgi:dihydrofolate reductase
VSSRNGAGIACKEEQVSKVVVFENLTLDGVMQAPGRPDEDPRGGFTHGGWAEVQVRTPEADPVLASVTAASMANTGALLLGWRTYLDLYGYWPKQTENPFTEVLNNIPKYVASTTAQEPLPWRNSTLLEGDATKAVAKLKQQPGKDMVVIGSGELVQSLRRHNLVDTYVLLIHPLVLGSGRRLFPDGAPLARLRLIDTKATTTGVLVATYQPTEPTAGTTS